ncbi:MAG TPA: ACP phosphodiesterase [Niabella sp.]|nr:ACP phosphodiesterase [Niabella sp.]
MNFLAHAYLSFDNKDILLGNMISDFVKGKKQFEFPPVVQKGILLHRDIDAFTDAHEATKTAKEVFRKEYRLYSGAFMDVVYDYFLANDPVEFTEASLFQFSQRTYTHLNKNIDWMPEQFGQMFHYMQLQNWLFGYRTKEGIHKSFGGLVRRAAYIQDSQPAIEIFETHIDFLQKCYNQFWAEAKPHILNRYQELMS